MPGDAEWPSIEEWGQLNDTVQGRLIAAVPLASICHGSEYSETACDSLRESWVYAAPHIEDPTSIYSPYWLNNSCSPFTSPNSTCTLGNLVSYTINVSCAADVVAGVSFAQANNIRLVVKNTGHDFLGRSTGRGALGLWTHNLRDISFFDYDTPEYRGGAVRLGAGVEGSELNEAADARGVRTVTGWCPSVGIAGGYTQGGGHGPLASAYGLAADNTLAFEVVTTEGKHLVASKTQYSDLYWALSGGGAGTYAIVLAQISKTHPDGPVAGASLSMAHDDSDIFWNNVFTHWQDLLLEFDRLPELSSGYLVTSTSFAIGFISWPEHTGREVAEVLAPFLGQLHAHNFTFNLTTSTEPGYLAHYLRYSPPDYPDFGVIGGRLIPRTSVENNGTAIVAAIRHITSKGQFPALGGQMNVSYASTGSRPGDNAVLPAWREALYTLYSVGSWDPTGSIANLQALQRAANDDLIAPLREVTPGSGSYSNEATFDLKTWKEDYYGENYGRLLEVKKTHDPLFVLYGSATVGSDYWEVAEDGRLCRSD
ncbi:FAD binding domain-containing protein [Xylariales sp. AK1849]|nr:FAD binding domain-containing protein [Xylariales sp. AK1849]